MSWLHAFICLVLHQQTTLLNAETALVCLACCLQTTAGGGGRIGEYGWLHVLLLFGILESIKILCWHLHTTAVHTQHPALIFSMPEGDNQGGRSS